MQLVGQKVTHRAFGRGVVTEVLRNGDIVTVHFNHGEKRFLYPDAFYRFLTLEDSEKQEKINQDYRRQHEIEEAQREKEREAQERRIRISSMKVTPDSQAAFHMGGRSDARREDMATCLRDGLAFTGRYLSGKSKGEPRLPLRLKPNSGYLLTGIPDGGEERERRIYGVYMVGEDFLGEYCRDGRLEAHAQYRLRLPDGGALSYWKYFAQEGPVTRWGNVPFKYFSNSIMEELLADVVKQLAGTEQAGAAAEFYQYFCRRNHLPVKGIEGREGQ